MKFSDVLAWTEKYVPRIVVLPIATAFGLVVLAGAVIFWVAVVPVAWLALPVGTFNRHWVRVKKLGPCEKVVVGL